MGNSLKKPLIGVICGAIFIAFLIFLVIVRQVIFDDYRRNIETNDKKFAEVLSQNINYHLQRCFDLGGMAANYPNYLRTDREIQQNILKRTLEKQPSYEFLAIVDKDGKPFISTDENFSDVNKNIYSWFKVMRRDAKPDISPAYYSEKTQNLVMTFVQGIEENGEVVASVVGDINLDHLQNLIHEFNKNNSCRAYLIDKNGTSIAQADAGGKIYNYRSMTYSTVAKNEEDQATFTQKGHVKLRESSFMASQGLTSAIRAAMKGESGDDFFVDENQRRYFCCYQPIKLPMVQTSWALVIVHPTGAMIDNLDKIIYRAMFGGVIIVTLIAFAMAKFAEIITTPILKMAEMATRVRNGDLSGQLDIKLDNEIGELANNINHMIRAIRANQEKSAESEKRLKVTANYDALTGLPNRNHFLIQLRQIIERSVQTRFYGALLFVDADKFKSVNDTYGHAVGDGLLIEFGKRIVDTVGNKEAACRYGGDEFLVFLLGYNEEDTRSVCNRLVQKMREPVDAQRRDRS